MAKILQVNFQMCYLTTCSYVYIKSNETEGELQFIEGCLFYSNLFFSLQITFDEIKTFADIFSLVLAVAWNLCIFMCQFFWFSFDQEDCKLDCQIWDTNAFWTVRKCSVNKHPEQVKVKYELRQFLLTLQSNKDLTLNTDLQPESELQRRMLDVYSISEKQKDVSL